METLKINVCDVVCMEPRAEVSFPAPKVESPYYSYVSTRKEEILANPTRGPSAVNFRLFDATIG